MKYTRRWPPPQIPMSELEWEETGPPESPEARLLTTIVIGDQPMHLEAWQVRKNADGEWHATVWDDDYLAWSAGLEPDQQMGITKINRRSYIMVAFPFS